MLARRKVEYSELFFFSLRRILRTDMEKREERQFHLCTICLEAIACCKVRQIKDTENQHRLVTYARYVVETS